jgi:hypothetical protein
MRFEVLTAVKMTMLVFWVEKPTSQNGITARRPTLNNLI